MKWSRAISLVLLTVALLVASIGCTNRDTTPPSEPSNLVKTTPDNDNTPTFTWEASIDETGIKRYLARVDDGEWVEVKHATTYTSENAVSDGSHVFEVKAVDKAGNEGTAVSLVFVCHTGPPVISAVTAVAVKVTAATITWTTDEPAASQVLYGSTPSYDLDTALDSTLVITHSVSLVGLTPASTYHYTVRSLDEAGNLGFSGDYTFTTSDFALDINHWSSSEDSGYRVWWTVLNQSSSSVDLAFELRLYNSSAALMSTEHHNIEDLDSGETWKAYTFFAFRSYPDAVSHSFTLEAQVVSTVQEPVTDGSVTLVGQNPIYTSGGSKLDITVKNETQNTLQSVTLEIKYYWLDDGNLRYVDIRTVGPIPAGESIWPGIKNMIGSPTVAWVFVTGYS